MSGFYALLKKIEARPGLYIGSPSVSNLFMFLAGYQFSRAEQGLPVTAEEEDFAGFQLWVQQRFGLETTTSWAKILMLQAADEGSGFELFFELLDEFVESSAESASAIANGSGARSEQLTSLEQFSEDFLEERQQPAQQGREALLSRLSRESSSDREN